MQKIIRFNINGFNSRGKLDGVENIRKDGGAPRVYIPDLLARWPWPRQVNPHYSTIDKEATAWIESFHAFSPKAQEAFNRCNFREYLLTCLIYPNANKELVRTGCDLTNISFLLDEHSDRSPPSEVCKQKDIVLDALRNPHEPRPKGEWIGGEIIRQYWERTSQMATEVSQKRFIHNMDNFLQGLLQEAVDRKDHRIRDVKSYIDLRRHTVGVMPALSIPDLKLDIPDEVMSHPSLQEMTLATLDMICFCNDVCSFNVEHMRGDEFHNIISCVMHEYGTDVNGAILWVQDYVSEAIERFLTAMESLPQLEEPLNSQVREYCNSMAEVVRGNDVWSYESEKYFGNKGQEIMKNKWMSLMPRKSINKELGPAHVDGSLL